MSTHQHEMSTQANKDEVIDCVDFPPQPHPLRILSEENLTIVSSFAGSLNELPNSDDEKVDASKLSFFQVPDFATIDGNENDRIMHGGIHDILKDKVKREKVFLKNDYIVRITGRASPYNINR